MGELLETPALRGQVARFLHKHKDDEDYSSNMIRAYMLPLSRGGMTREALPKPPSNKGSENQKYRPL
jgi:hypothetical protein